MIDQVLEDLYVSGAGAVIGEKGRQQLKDLNITHVLTISAAAVPLDKRLNGIDYRFIFAMDLPQQDLLATGKLREGIEYIENVMRKHGRLLVHCEAGISRSATFLAAYIMKRNLWSRDKAIALLQKARPTIQPNEGFLQQLAVFENSDHEITKTTNTREYRRVVMETAPPLSSKDESAQYLIRDLNESSSSDEKNRYRCGKCRQVLFYSEHLSGHKRNDGQACTLAYLIEPMKWMTLEEYEGKISCPSCHEKLGNYSWGGRTCEGELGQRCRTHVAPWVHLHKSRVDEVKPRPSINEFRPTAGIRTEENLPKVVIS